MRTLYTAAFRGGSAARSQDGSRIFDEQNIFKIQTERRKIVSVLELMNILRTMDGETEIRLLPHPEDGISCAAMLAEVMEVTHMHEGEHVENHIVLVPAE